MKIGTLLTSLSTDEGIAFHFTCEPIEINLQTNPLLETGLPIHHNG